MIRWDGESRADSIWESRMQVWCCKRVHHSHAYNECVHTYVHRNNRTKHMQSLTSAAGRTQFILRKHATTSCISQPTPRINGNMHTHTHARACTHTHNHTPKQTWPAGVGKSACNAYLADMCIPASFRSDSAPCGNCSGNSTSGSCSGVSPS